jgi:branched-subunit amino acid aminotransferase/4-amino-4-deoxychorismate lyase
VEPVVCTVAAEGHGGGENETITVDTSLPSRFQDPQNKIASWTRLRKKMEKPETYKPAGVSEVLMVRPSKNGSLELLEGLTSNLFVLYQDGSLRTPFDGVLYGYVRHLVLECADSCGLTVDSKPILLQDASAGLWREAFITSSSRLIFPISKILIHDDCLDKDGAPMFREHWRDPVLSTSDAKDDETSTPKWRELLDEILRRGGYRV